MSDEQYYNEQAVQNVERGALVLDRINPNWFNEIDPDILDIGSCTRCVVGQLIGDYAEADNVILVLEAIDPQESWRSPTGGYPYHGKKAMNDHGFDSTYEVGHRDLTTAWRDLIEKRRANA